MLRLSICVYTRCMLCVPGYARLPSLLSCTIPNCRAFAGRHERNLVPPTATHSDANDARQQCVIWFGVERELVALAKMKMSVALKWHMSPRHDYSHASFMNPCVLDVASHLRARVDASAQRVYIGMCAKQWVVEEIGVRVPCPLVVVSTVRVRSVWLPHRCFCVWVRMSGCKIAVCVSVC